MKSIKAYPRRYFLGSLILLTLIISVETALLIVGPERVLDKLRLMASGRNYEVPVAILVSYPITIDPLSKYQWGLRMMLDGVSYQEVQGDAPRDVIVAVIDRGVHMNHPDLDSKGVDGWNFIDNSASLREQYDGKSPNCSIAHGQCSASIIAAETNNGEGIAGVFARAYIMPLQTDLNHMADAIEFAVDHDADVILIAGGGGEILWPMYETNELRPREGLYTSDNLCVIRDIKQALGKAYDANVPVVVGVGNTARFAVTLLAEDYRTIAVAPHNILGEVSVNTSFSYAFELFAPGGSRKMMTNIDEISVEFPQDLIVFHPRADYDDPVCAIGSDGYSFLTLGSGAVPHVAGAIAMIKSYLPDATVEDVREILRQGQVPLTPSGSVLEGLAGRISLRRIRIEIERRLDQ